MADNIFFICKKLRISLVIGFIFKAVIGQKKFTNYIPELGTIEWDILNPDQLINLEIKNKRRTSII